MQRNKYGNRKIKIGNLTFDSKKEYQRYQELLILQRAGAIQNLQLQVSFELAPKVKFSNEARAKSAIRYVADFVYEQDGETVVEDVKSKITAKNPVYRLKKHLMKSVHGLEIVEL